MDTVKHTPFLLKKVPDINSDVWKITTKTGLIVGYIPLSEKSLAEFIVRACNSHYDLLEIGKALLSYIDAIPKSTQLPPMPGIDRDWVNEIITKAEEK